jgi:hypothetical protein
MNLFRSEEHIDAWLEGRPAGTTISVTTLCDLAHRWWRDRLAPDWHPHTRSQNQAIFEDLGLTGPFWQLP